MKWFRLTNTSRPSREPLLLFTGTLAIWWQTEWEWIPAWSVLFLSLSVIVSVSAFLVHKHATPLWTWPVCCDNVMWHRGPGMMCVIFHARQRDNDIGLPCVTFVKHVYCFIGKSKTPFYCQRTDFKCNSFWADWTEKYLLDINFYLIWFSATIFSTWRLDIFIESVWYLSKAEICCHTDRHTIKKIIPGGLIWSKMMNTCMVYMAIQFPLDGIHWCLCFIFWGEGNADLLEREKATAEGYGVITSLSFKMSLS